MRRFLSRISDAFVSCMVAIGAVFLIGCGSTGTDSGGLVTSTGQYYESLQVSLTTRTAANIGDVVPITFTLKNIGTEPIFLSYGLLEADAQVKQGYAEIWRWSFGKAFSLIGIGQLLAPGESKTYSWNWEQQDNEGRQVSLGTYTINAWFNADSVNYVKVSPEIDLAAKPITIVLQ